MVWILEYTFYDDIDGDKNKNIAIWNTEFDAYKSACGQIQDCISENWNMYNFDDATNASDINALIATGTIDSYKKAVYLFNASGTTESWYITCQSVHNSPSTPTIFPEDYFTALLSKEEDEEEEIEKSEPKEEEYKATECGATCRQCKQYNEYVYADRQDGTYVCRSCKMMQDVFGS